MLSRCIQVLALLLCLSLLFVQCGPSAEPEARVLLIGLDGIEMSILKPMLEKGEMPNLARLIDRGVFGYMRTFEPTLSPVIWTTLATGKSIDEHKVIGFIDVNTGGPFTSNARKGKALWNIAKDYSLKSNVTGYWITWPAEEINGIMVSQVTTREQVDDVWKGMLYKNVDHSTYPEDFIEEIWPVVEPFQTPEYLHEVLLRKIFGEVDTLNPSYEVMDLISQSIWSFAGDYIYFETAKYILDNYPGDLDIVYLGGTDVIAHRFWRFREPDAYTYRHRIKDKYIQAFEEAIDRYYRLADQMVGELVERVPKKTRIIIVSDHGMHADFLDGTDKGKVTQLSAHHMDAPPGIIIAAGEGIREGAGLALTLQEENLEELGNVFDLTPTILYLLDIPVGRNMKLGKVMKKVVSEDLLKSRPVEFIDSHDIDFRPPTSSRSSREGNKAFIDKFAALGYIDGTGEPAEKPKMKMGPGRKK